MAIKAINIKWNVLEKKVLKIEKEALELKRTIHKMKVKNIDLNSLVESISKKIAQDQDIDQTLNETRKRGLDW